MEPPLWKIHWFGICELLNRRPARINLEFMRPLFHPAIEDVTVEGILYALSDPVRGAIFAGIALQRCTVNCSNFLTVSDQAIPKSTLSQHFKILRENGLIRSERQGVELLNTSRCEELDARFPGLIRAILNAHAIQSGQQPSAKRTRKKSPDAQQSKARSRLGLSRR